MSIIHLIPPTLRTPALNILLQAIINQFLSESYCITLVSDKPMDFNFNLSFTYIVPKATVRELKDQLLEVSEMGCSDYIVNMRDQPKFMSAYDMASRAGNIRRSDRKIIFLPSLKNPKRINRAFDLFFMKETNFIAHILMILQSAADDTDCDTYDLVTHKFIGSDETSHQPILLNQWDSCKEEFKTNANLFPHNINNLLGKTVKIAAFTYKPYVFLDLDPRVAPNGRDGIELRIVEEFCRWVNCTIQIIIEDKDQWGKVFDNGTGVGIIGSVVEDKADIGIGALYSWYEEFLYLDFSAAIVRSAITCVAPSPRLLASWTTPVMPFTWNMWYAVLLTFLITCVGLVIAKRGSFDGIFITVFGVMIAQSQKSVEQSWRVRSITGWLLVASLILASAYGGGLATTFTVSKYEASIDTIQDLVDRNMEWGATHDAWIFSLTLSPDPLIKKLVSQFRTYPAADLKKKSFTRTMAFSVEKLPAGHFAIGDYLTPEALVDLTLMLENFYYEQCVVMLRKSSPYTEKMSALVGKLHQSGLLLTWETQVALKHLSFKAQQEVKLSRLRRDVGFKPLDLFEVVGIFILYGIGVVLSILFFITEQYMRKKNT